jgi:DNA helicase-2/ATP-dependent DNA helicase PcrA
VHAKLYDQVKNINYGELIHIYEYRKEYSPYSTQHGVKGAEFDNVFVVLDNGKWNKYNFEYLFTGDGNENVKKRTRKIFYVCCSRTKKNLVVFYHKPSSLVINKANQWFGAENVLKIE